MHPAAAKTIDRIKGYTWVIELFDYNSQMGVCGKTFDGRRQAVCFNVLSSRMPDGSHPKTQADYESACVHLIEQAKVIVIDAIQSGRYYEGDQVVQGNEIPM